MRKILIVLAILIIATKISIAYSQQTNKIKVLTYETESSNIKYVSCNSLEVKKLKEEVIKLNKQEKNGKVMPQYDIPLDTDIQQYLYNKCEEYEIPYELVVSVIKIESNFDTNIVNKNSNNSKDKSLMQINSIHREEFLKQGYSDMLNPYQNIAFGVKLLANLYHKYNDEHYALMAFNFGETGARKIISRGIASSKYSRKVVDYKNKLIVK
jgi:soluble lytic murein transglycosylase-like protein